MFDLSILTTFILASIAILIVPGPTVTVIIANSIRYGSRAGLMNVAGTQLGVAMIFLVVAFGLEIITTTLAWVFDWVRILGAGYLIWLGYKLLRSDGSLGVEETGGTNTEQHYGTFFWQGLLVVLSNPKLLFFAGAFLPQFVDPAGNTFVQTVSLGVLFMALATVLDGAYAVAAGGAGGLLTKRNVRTVEVGAGSLMIGGGLWLAFTRNA